MTVGTKLRLLTILFGIFTSSIDGKRYVQRTFGTIVGGNKAERHEYPWHILLTYNNRFRCGGSIINDWTVLTAAHCILKDPNQRRYRYSIIAGEMQRMRTNGKEQYINVTTLVKHPDFDKTTLVNDIALLHLEQPLKLNRNVQPVVLANASFDQGLRVKGTCYASGFGLQESYPSTNLAKVLQELQVNIITNPTCNKRLQRYKESVDDSMTCTYNEGAAVCQGDSGGPMGCYDDAGIYRQVGIVSWAPTANCLLPPSVYTRVCYFLDWINDNMYNGTDTNVD